MNSRKDSFPFPRSPMKRIFHIQWHITNLCNLRCRHCYQEDFSAGTDRAWPGLKRVSENILTTIGGWDQRACLHLTGGEPLLKPELFPLLAELNQHPLVEELGIITNGLLLDHEKIHRLKAFSKLQKIKISLDGADAETNDSIRPAGTFHRVMQNLSLLKREGPFTIILMFTVMKRNVSSLPAIIHLCQDWGIDGLIIERFIPWGRGREIRGEVLGRDQWKSLTERLFDYFSVDREEDGVSPFQAFQVNFQGGDSELLGAPCVLGVEGLCIMPDGTVFPCRRFPLPIGNLLEDTLKNIWERSHILEKLRKKENLKGKCGRCPVKECMGCRSLAFSLTGDYLAEDPHCWMAF